MITKQIDVSHLSIEEAFFTFSKQDQFTFFDSSDEESKRSRYSMMMWQPFKMLTVHQDTLTLKTDTTTHTEPFTLEALHTYLSEYSQGIQSDLPFCGGVVGVVGYEAARYLSDYAFVRSSNKLPEFTYLFYNHALLFDHETQKNTWIQVSFPNIPLMPEPDFTSLTSPSNKPIELPEPSATWTKPRYLEAFDQVKNYIAAGDTYQINLSHRFEVPFSGDASQLYWQLRTSSPAPYSSYIQTQDFTLFSASPELYVSIDGDKIETHPIKGTRPRGDSKSEDNALKEELVNSQKDNAELRMIVDLERNDLNRICKRNTVKVPVLKELESYAQVHHLVSRIQGQLTPMAHSEAILALFPGGSITGAPKIRSMEIIQELEPVSRELYTGVVGYHSSNGKTQFNIAIRSMYTHHDMLYFHSGGGIVADSQGGEEWKETFTKIKGLRLSMSKKEPSDIRSQSFLKT